jgi:hypothetical protein
MAKISTEYFNYPGKGNFQYEVKVSAKGIFSIKYPKEVSDFFDLTEVTGNTKDEVVKVFEANLKRYFDAITSERKVILFRADITATIYIHKDRGNTSYTEPTVKRRDFPFAEGIKLGLQADVFIEKKVVSGIEERYEYDRVRDSMIPKSIKLHENLFYFRDGAHKHHVMVLDWTEEREKTLSLLCLNFETLIININSFTERNDVFEKMVDSGFLGLFDDKKVIPLLEDNSE